MYLSVYIHVYVVCAVSTRPTCLMLARYVSICVYTCTCSLCSVDKANVLDGRQVCIQTCIRARQCREDIRPINSFSLEPIANLYLCRCVCMYVSIVVFLSAFLLIGTPMLTFFSKDFLTWIAVTLHIQTHTDRHTHACIYTYSFV
jgi:hypothetical protein